MSVSVLEMPFRVVFGPGVPDAAAARIAESWASCATEPAQNATEILADVADAAPPAPDADVRVLTRTIAQLEESLTSTLTVEAIGLRRGDLLMLHAAGIAAQDGRVLAFVAASGTGKTTIARALGTRFGYVTDETVGVTAEGRVLPYPKPLSVKPLSGSAPKAQLAPGAAGLLPAPDAPLVLAGVVLLDRRDGVEEARLEPVDPIEALDDLVPQTSYLSARPRPISGLVATLAALGGVRRLVYSEAEDVVDLVAAILASDISAAPASWNEVVPLDIGVGDADGDGEGLIRRAPADDALSMPGGEIVVFCADTLVRLSGIGPAVWRLSAGGVRPGELLRAVLSEVGEPPPGVDAEAAVRAALDELVDLGLIASTPSSPTTPDEARA